MGRPHDIDKVVSTDRDGQPVTAGERIIQALAAGNYVETAALAAGVSKVTLHHWLSTGARATADVHRGRRTARSLTAFERRCQAFSNAVVQTEHEWEVRQLATLEQLARGGIEQVTVTEKRDSNNNLVERTTKTERMAPNPQVLEWRLTRRCFPRYSEHQRVEVTGAEGAPLLDGGAAVDRLRAVLERIAPSNGDTPEQVEAP